MLRERGTQREGERSRRKVRERGDDSAEESCLHTEDRLVRYRQFIRDISHALPRPPIASLRVPPRLPFLSFHRGDCGGGKGRKALHACLQWPAHLAAHWDVAVPHSPPCARFALATTAVAALPRIPAVAGKVERPRGPATSLPHANTAPRAISACSPLQTNRHASPACFFKFLPLWRIASPAQVRAGASACGWAWRAAGFAACCLLCFIERTSDRRVLQTTTHISRLAPAPCSCFRFALRVLSCRDPAFPLPFQFAHGTKELRSVQRHRKYKTELCRTFHRTGACPYGKSTQVAVQRPGPLSVFAAFCLSTAHRHRHRHLSPNS